VRETIAKVTSDEWEESRRRVDEAERERTKRIFGDEPPTIYIDRYDDM